VIDAGPPPPVVVEVTVDPPSLGLAFGTAGALTVTAHYDDGSSVNAADIATYTSDQAWIASAQNGLVTAGQLSGDAIIDVDVDGVSASVSVLVAPSVPTALAFVAPPTALAVGLERALSVNVTLGDGTTRSATASAVFSSSDDTRAVVDDDGVALGIGAGPVTLTARLGALQATATPTVTAAALASIAVTLAPTAVFAGQASQATAIGTFADGAVVDVSRDAAWSSNNGAIASPEGALGRIRANAQGTANITASLAGVTSPAATLNVAPLVVLRVSSSNKHSLALWSDDSVSAWGWNADGELGQVSADQGTPVAVTSLPRIRAIEAGGRTSYVVDENGRALAFGSNAEGQLGRGDTTPTSDAVPTAVRGPFNAPTMERVVSVRAGYGHALFLDEDGFVYALGDNANGQLGLGDTEQRTVPERVPGLPRITRIAAGAFHSMAIDANGALWSWGDNATWQQANGTTNDVLAPAQIGGLGGVVVFDAVGGWGHTLVLSNQGNIYGWGWNTAAQLGIGNQVDQPAPVFIIGGAIAIATTYIAGAAISNLGGAFTWGSNAFGQLGINSVAAGSVDPLPVASPSGAGTLTNIVILEGGADHFVALNNGVNTFAWGRNAEHGQVGDGSFVDRRFPVALPALQP